MQERGKTADVLWKRAGGIADESLTGRSIFDVRERAEIATPLGKEAYRKHEGKTP